MFYSFECNHGICFRDYKCTPKCKHFCKCSSCIYGMDCKFSESGELSPFCKVNVYLRYHSVLKDSVQNDETQQ